MDYITPLSQTYCSNEFNLLLGAAFSIVNEADPYLMSKKYHLKNWCRAFIALFIKEEDAAETTYRMERLPFFLDILSDEECWEESDTIHRVNFNRRKAAKKIVQSHSRSGLPNPLNFCEVYRVACSCCLEEDIVTLFESFKQNSGIRSNNPEELNKLIGIELSKGGRSEPLTVYWSRLIGGLEMQLQGKHLYEFGLDLVYAPYVTYVEAVEFYWNKIRSVPVDEMRDEQKHVIFVMTAVRSLSNRMGDFPEVLEFCIRQITRNLYPYFLKKEYNELGGFYSLGVLLENLCFDVYKNLFHYLDPKFHVSLVDYYSTLKRLVTPDYSENYANEAIQLFMYMWMREGYDDHRRYVLDSELRSYGTLLYILVHKSLMELVWAILDKENRDQIKVFMRAEKANYISHVLIKRGDQFILNKFLSYNYVVRQPSKRQLEPSASGMDEDDDPTSPSNTKKQRLK